VTGSAIAIPLLGATGASAASGTTWDRVAECESGGSWSADSGNGHYGGLQLTQRDWEKYGGLDYAPSADQASRSQQIAVAEKILDDRGVSAWPGCGSASGLSEDSGSADVDTGLGGGSSSGGFYSDSGMDSGLSESSGSSASVTPSLSSSSSSSSSHSSRMTTDSDEGGSGTRGHRGSDNSSDAQTKHDESDKSGRKGSSSSEGANNASGAGRHRGDSAEEDAAEGRTGDSSGRHASRDSGVTRDAADGSYTVRPGDSLSAIADSLDLKGGWVALYGANKKTVGDDPDLILPGQSLALDEEPSAERH
jgi:hypothetical protein